MIFTLYDIMHNIYSVIHYLQIHTYIIILYCTYLGIHTKSLTHGSCLIYIIFDTIKQLAKFKLYLALNELPYTK